MPGEYPFLLTLSTYQPSLLLKDGKAAGQSVPHVHFHILPRKAQGDRFSENNDQIYPELEIAEGNLMADLHEQEQQKNQPLRLKMDADENRKPRTMEEMVAEADWLRGFFTEDDLKDTVD